MFTILTSHSQYNYSPQAATVDEHAVVKYMQKPVMQLAIVGFLII